MYCIALNKFTDASIFMYFKSSICLWNKTPVINGLWLRKAAKIIAVMYLIWIFPLQGRNNHSDFGLWQILTNISSLKYIFSKQYIKYCWTNYKYNQNVLIRELPKSYNKNNTWCLIWVKESVWSSRCEPKSRKHIV